MLDMGLEESVKSILNSIPSTNENGGQNRITHLFSATLPANVENLAKTITHNAAIISIGKPGLGKKEILQKVEMVTNENKKKHLIKVLEKSTPPIIVFVNQKIVADTVKNMIETKTKVCY